MKHRLTSEQQIRGLRKGFFFGPLKPICGKQCRFVDLIVPKLPCWPIRPTLHIRRNSNDPRQSLPMPGMRAAPAGADFRSVRLGETEGGCYERNRDPCEARLNLLEVGLFIEPSWLIRWSPSPLSGGMSALFLGVAGPGLATVPGHSPELCSLHKYRFGNSNGARRAITPTELD